MTAVGGEQSPVLFVYFHNEVFSSKSHDFHKKYFQNARCRFIRYYLAVTLESSIFAYEITHIVPHVYQSTNCFITAFVEFKSKSVFIRRRLCFFYIVSFADVDFSCKNTRVK